MLAISSDPKLPKTNHRDLFRDPKFYKEGLELSNIDLFAQRPDLLSNYFSLIPKYYFKNAPLLMRKTCLLFPESGTNICHLGVMVSQQGLEIDDRGELILPEQRNEVAARLYRQAKTPLSFYNLQAMLLAKKIQHDENNENCKTDSDVYVAVARLLQKSLKPYVEKYQESSMYPLPLHDFAYLIRMGFINTDQTGARLSKLDKRSRNKKAAGLLREVITLTNLSNSRTQLAGMIFYNETDLDEEGEKLTTDKSKFSAIERLCSGVNTGEARFIEALVYSRNGDTANALTRTEQALQKGYTQALSLYYQLKALSEASALKASADDSEDDDIETDDEKVEEITETTFLHQREENSSDASVLAYRAQQAQQAASWKTRVFEQRRTKWQEKKATAFTYTPSQAQEKTIAEHWDKLAVNGRLKLAELWDQRIINLVDAIKAGDTRLGAPKMLDGDYDGWMSRRISQKHRLVYNFVNEMLVVKECGQHYKGR
jgi:toxin YoeB